MIGQGPEGSLKPDTGTVTFYRNGEEVEVPVVVSIGKMSNTDIDTHTAHGEVVALYEKYEEGVPDTLSWRIQSVVHLHYPSGLGEDAKENVWRGIPPTSLYSEDGQPVESRQVGPLGPYRSRSAA